MLTTLAVLLLAIARSNAIFYDTSGNEHVTFFPYNASAEVGVCCSGSDYCLDNGLCLDAAGDNIFTVQGCRFNTWEPPCKQYCPDLPPTTNWYQDLTLCRTNDRVSGEYCCGQDASCCSDTSSFITLPIFKSVYRGVGAAALSSAPGSSPSSSVSSTSTLPTTPLPWRKANGNALRLGLGLGPGLGLGLLAPALSFIGWELRRRNAQPKMEVSYESSQDAVLMHENRESPQELHDDVIKVELPGDQGF